MKFIKLESFQRRCVNEIKDYYYSNKYSNQWALLNSPTSTGKSFIGLFTLMEIIAENPKLKGIYCTFSSVCESDINQKIVDIKRLGTKINSIEVHTMAYLFKHPELFKNNDYVVVVDEAHHLTKNGEYRNFLKKEKNIKFLLGMTGTPRKSFLADGFNIIKPIYRSDTNFKYPQIIKKEISFNAKYVVEQLGRKDNFYQVENTDQGITELAKYQSISFLINYFTEEVYNKSKRSGQSLIICNSVAIANALVDNINTVFNSEWKSGCITGETPPKLRNIIIENFKNNKIQFLIGVDALVEGFDVPNITSVFIFDNVNSDIRYSQIVGRGLRPDEGKHELSIYDYRLCFDKFQKMLTSEDYLYKSSKHITSSEQEKEDYLKSHYRELTYYAEGKIVYIKTQVDHRKLYQIMIELMGIDTNLLREIAIGSKNCNSIVLTREQIKFFLINITHVLKEVIPYVEDLSENIIEVMDKNFEEIDNSSRNIDCTPRETKIIRLLVEPLIESSFNIQNLKREHPLSNSQRLDLYFSDEKNIYIFEFAIDVADAKLDQIKNYAHVLKSDRDCYGGKDLSFKLFIIGCTYLGNTESRDIDDEIKFINWFDFFFSYILKIKKQDIEQISNELNSKAS
jgi:superfamily II DNA or RNA helicase